MAVSCLDALLKGLQVNLADGLLGGPGAEHTVAVGLLVVEGKVLHEGVNALLLSAHDGVGSHRTGQYAVLSVILEVTACKGRAVDVHSRCVPARNIHVVGHLADGGAEVVCQIGVPGGCDHHSGGEADGTLPGEVVVDRGRTVAVDGLHLADGIHCHSLEAAQSNELVHVRDSELIQEGIPLGVVVIHAHHVLQLQAVLGTGGGSHVVGVVEVLGVPVGVVVEGSLSLCRQLEVCGSSGSLGVVGKAVCAGQVGHIALGKVELVVSDLHIALTLVGSVVDDVGSHIVDLGIQNGVGVGVDADDVIALFQHIAALAVGIVGGHILGLEGNGDVLGSAGSQLRSLCKADQVCRSLLDAAVGVGRVIVDLHHFLAGGRTGVGDGDIHSDGAVSLGNAVQGLGEGGVAQAAAEGIHHSLVVVDEALGGGSLVELVAHIDAFHIVHESRDGVGAKGVGLELIHVGVGEVAKVVRSGGLGQVVHKGIDGTAGGVHITAEDGAQCVEAALTGACAPDNALDLAVILDPAQFHSVGAVVDHNDLIKVLADQIDHVLLGLGQLQVVVAGLKVVVAVACVVGDLRHIGGQVCTFAAHAGDDYHGGIRESLGVVHHLVGVLCSLRLRQGPVLSEHTHLRAVSTVRGVEVAQLSIQLKAGILQALQQGNGGVGVGQRTGTGAAVAGVGGSPAKNVQLAVLGHGQGAIVIQQNDAFIGNVLAQLGSGCHVLLADLAVAGGKGDHGVHGAGQDQVHGNGQCQHHAQTRLPADQILFGLALLTAGDHDCDQQNCYDTKADQLRFDRVEDLDDVIHIDGQHSFLLLSSYVGVVHRQRARPCQHGFMIPEADREFSFCSQSVVLNA